MTAKPLHRLLVQVIGLAWLLGGLVGPASAVQVSVTLDWTDGFTAKDSTGANLTTNGPTVQLGWFSGITSSNISTTVTRANLGTYFTTFASTNFLGIPAGSDNQYAFDGDNTTVDELDANNEPTGNDPATKTTLYMVITSGLGDLGIFKWVRNAVDFFFPRDPSTYTNDRTALATQVGVANSFNTVAVVGTVSATGLTLTNTGASASVPDPTLRLLSVGTPVYTNGNTVITHTFAGNSNAAYVIEYKGSLTEAWKTNAVSVNSSTNFSVTFTNIGVNSTNDWKSRMFFRVKNG
jgi:hypothetical protein